MIPTRSLIAGLLLAVSLSIPAPVQAAEEISIQDTQGIVRAASSVDGSGIVEFTAVDATGAAAEGAEVTLTNAATGEVLTAVTSNGVVAFEGVAPGVWTVASSAPGLTFTNVTVTSTVLAAGAGLPGAVALSTLGTGGAVAGGVAAVAVGVNEATDDSSSKDRELSPSS